jgi:hypothetical protein
MVQGLSADRTRHALFSILCACAEESNLAVENKPLPGIRKSQYVFLQNPAHALRQKGRERRRIRLDAGAIEQANGGPRIAPEENITFIRKRAARPLPAG